MVSSISTARRPLAEYEAMVIEAHEAPERYNIIAAVSNWIYLAGFVTLPGTFTAIRHSSSVGKTDAGAFMQEAVRNIPLLVLGYFTCCVGAAGISWSSWKMRSNLIWLRSHIFM